MLIYEAEEFAKGLSVLADKHSIPKLRMEAATLAFEMGCGHIKTIHKIRIEIHPDGAYSVMDVTGESPQMRVTELSPELKDKLSLMLLLDPDTEVEDLGYRYSATVFYVNGD